MSSIDIGSELNKDQIKDLLVPRHHIHTTSPRRLFKTAPPTELTWVKVLTYLDTIRRDFQTQGFKGKFVCDL